MTQDGVRYDLAFLRSLEWLSDAGAAEGGAIELHLPEMGLTGPALVECISACPPLEADDGSGRMIVTGTMAHFAENVLDIKISNLDEPLGVTTTHPIWSEDRQDFVPAGQLRIGEHLQSSQGTLTQVTRITPRRGPPEIVYNLEVDGEHVYQVADDGVLVHNSCPNALPLTGRPHGGAAHDSAIDDLVSRVTARKGKDIRKNQALVDAYGNKISNLRPDLQWTQNGVRHIVQVVDSNPITHEATFRMLIPDAVIKIIPIR